MQPTISTGRPLNSLASIRTPLLMRLEALETFRSLVDLEGSHPGPAAAGGLGISSSNYSMHLEDPSLGAEPQRMIFKGTTSRLLWAFHSWRHARAQLAISRSHQLSTVPLAQGRV